jgi:hypothetical protein
VQCSAVREVEKEKVSLCVTSEEVGHLKRKNVVTDSEIISQAHRGTCTVGSTVAKSIVSVQVGVE